MLGDTDFDFGIFIFEICLDPTFPDFQVPRFPDSQISWFSDFQISRFQISIFPDAGAGAG